MFLLQSDCINYTFDISTFLFEIQAIILATRKGNHDNIRKVDEFFAANGLDAIH